MDLKNLLCDLLCLCALKTVPFFETLIPHDEITVILWYISLRIGTYLKLKLEYYCYHLTANNVYIVSITVSFAYTFNFPTTEHGMLPIILIGSMLHNLPRTPETTQILGVSKFIIVWVSHRNCCFLVFYKSI